MKVMFAHANSGGLMADLNARFPWLSTSQMSRRFHSRLEGRHISIKVLK